MTGRRLALLALSVVALAWSLGGEWVSIHAGTWDNHLIDTIAGLAFLGAGIVALDRRPGNAIGVLMVAFGFTWYLGNWGSLTGAPLLPLLGLMAGQIGAPLLAHIALGYPSGRVRSAFDRLVLGLIYAEMLGVNLFILLRFDPRAGGCTGCGWEPAPFPATTGDPIDAALQVSLWSGFVLVPLFLVAVWRRWWRASQAERRDLGPLWIATTILAMVFLVQAFTAPDSPPGTFGHLLEELRGLLQIGLPIVFVWGLLSTRLARSAVGDLVLELRAPLRPGDLRTLLARTLHDPGLDLVYAVDGRWVTADGQGRALPDLPGAVTVIERDGSPLASLIHDPALDEGLVRATAAAAGMAIENERLHARVRAQLDEVLASRQRIVEAGDRERRRVERNLHDGAQQRLMTLAVSLAMLRDQAPDGDVAAALGEASAELKRAIEDLRELARGIHPAILTEEGLPAAVEALADRSSLPVQVTSSFEDRLPEPVEAAAYFVVAEALANVAKHARATKARIDLSLVDGRLRACIEDDGVGGADASRGSGLRGLEDRVSAVRGEFAVTSPSGGGTRVVAEMPADV